jgi:hypothetical protein
MTASFLTAELTSEFDDVPPTLIASAVRAATRRPGEAEAAVEGVARADVAALAEALRRSGSARSR